MKDAIEVRGIRRERGTYFEGGNPFWGTLSAPVFAHIDK